MTGKFWLANILATGLLITGLAVVTNAALAAGSPAALSGTPVTPESSLPSGMLSCPPQFLTEPEQRLYAKDGVIRSGPWHARCFQNGTSIFDHDRLYLSCQKNDRSATVETAEGHAIRFSFSPEIACIWER